MRLLNLNSPFSPDDTDTTRATNDKMSKAIDFILLDIQLTEFVYKCG